MLPNLTYISLKRLCDEMESVGKSNIYLHSTDPQLNSAHSKLILKIPIPREVKICLGQYETPIKV